MDKLVQRDRFLTKLTYELTEKGLSGKEKKLFSSTEFFVDYEDIGVRVLQKQNGSQGWLLASLITFAIGVIVLIYRIAGGSVGDDSEIFYGSAGMVFGVIYWFTYKKSFYLVQQGNKNAIHFFYNSPTKEDLDKFISTLKEKRKRILDIKYGQINEMLPYEENHKNLMWLYNNDVIEKSEFDARVDELNSKFYRPVEKKIGFNFPPSNGFEE